MCIRDSPSFNQEKDHFHEEVEAEDFGMVEDFGLQMEYSDEDMLPENTAPSSLNVGFVGVGGGGNKMANAMIELGFNKTLLVNSTGKDIPKNVEEEHVVVIRLENVSLGLDGPSNNPEVISVQLCTRNAEKNVFWVPQSAHIQVFQFVQKELVV